MSTRAIRGLRWPLLLVGLGMLVFNLRNYVQSAGHDRVLYGFLVLVWALWSYVLWRNFTRLPVKPRGVRVRLADGTVTGPHELAYLGVQAGLHTWAIATDFVPAQEVDAIAIDKLPKGSRVILGVLFEQPGLPD